jgi:hypothetical protein
MSDATKDTIDGIGNETTGRRASAEAPTGAAQTPSTGALDPADATHDQVVTVLKNRIFGAIKRVTGGD